LSVRPAMDALVSGMDRIWQWAWDRYGPRYSWAIYAVTVVAVLVLAYVMILPGLGESRLYERWAAGQEVDRARALDATYAWTRGAVARGVGANAVVIALLFVVVGAIAGASGLRLVQYAIMGAASGIAVVVIAVHSFPEAALRPVRVAIAGDTAIGDSLPRSRPTFAAWSSLSMLAAAFAFAVAGAALAAVFDRAREVPVLCVVIGCVLTVGFAVPITVGAVFSPSLRPIRDLAKGTERVAAGDYSQRLPVVQDDDLGATNGVVQPHAGRLGRAATTSGGVRHLRRSHPRGAATRAG